MLLLYDGLKEDSSSARPLQLQRTLRHSVLARVFLFLCRWPGPNSAGPQYTGAPNDHDVSLLTHPPPPLPSSDQAEKIMHHIRQVGFIFRNWRMHSKHSNLALLKGTSPNDVPS